MAIYIREKNTEIWHRYRNCSKYPTRSKVMVRATKPADDLVCKECQANARNVRYLAVVVICAGIIIIGAALLAILP